MAAVPELMYKCSQLPHGQLQRPMPMPKISKQGHDGRLVLPIRQLATTADRKCNGTREFSWTTAQVQEYCPDRAAVGQCCLTLEHPWGPGLRAGSGRDSECQAKELLHDLGKAFQNYRQVCVPS
eukprot:CAMPEP_0202338446 /NCGR_PEP_ID=MMETSP1126-20121109/719_1 /ASSEMBLY_ACC=CAM_ASM_000457 /TAXON_ID=3047 /ORGANISM="Dunaliella tertiolecta, Strain CCMP1320" /LENGTH=123 /DNA_ID=CAMNT_0048928827 /DNA_START=704 /DNA_END=1075 /DNA_ORIENTATION=+